MFLRARHLACLLAISSTLQAQTPDKKPLTAEEKFKVLTYVAQLEDAPQASDAKMKRSWVFHRVGTAPGFASILCTGLNDGWDPKNKDVQAANALLILQFNLGSYAYEVAHPDWDSHVEAAYQAGLESMLRAYQHIDQPALVDDKLDGLIKARDAGTLTQYVHDHLSGHCLVRPI